MVVRYRNEPCMIIQIIEIVAYLRRVQIANIIIACNRNTFNLFKYESKTRHINSNFYNNMDKVED